MFQQVILDQIWNLYFWKEQGLSSSKILRFLNQSQYWPREEMDNYQMNELNKLLALVSEKSPFYQQYYKKSKISLENISDLNLLPYLTKDIVVKNLPEIPVEGCSGKLAKHTTSGSTGVPLAIQISAEAQAFRKAGRYRFYSWWGIKPHDKNILVWAKKATSQPTQVTSLKKIKNAIRDNTIDRTLFINVFDLTKLTVKDYFNQSIAFRPRYIRGYLSGVLQFAELIVDAGLSVEQLNIQLVIVTSETLIDVQRTYLENVFQCPVANEYGAAEAGLFAFNCPSQNLHVFEEAVMMSTLPDGRVVVTEYRNTVTPLINYINNDVVTASSSSCKCGRTLKILEEIKGRTNDYVLKMNGDKISPYIFYYAVKELDDVGFENCVKKYKVKQNGSKFLFSLIKGPGFCDDVTVYLSNRIKKVVGEDVEVIFQFVDEIEREKSGKLRFFVQETDVTP